MATGSLGCLSIMVFALMIGALVTGCSSGGSSGQTNNAPTGTDTGETKAVLAKGSGTGGGTPGPQAPSIPVSFSGSGSLFSVYFLVNTNTVTASYSYDCSSTGGSGFAAYMISGSPSSPSYDAQTIADVSDTGGSANVTLYPRNPGSYYYFQVNSECAWTIVARGG